MPSDQPAVVVRNLHKEFALPQYRRNSVKQVFVNITHRNKKTVQKVLDGVSFEVQKGDFFGIVGRNGSGKSTLLKILAGVYNATSGEVAINGSLTPFIELGVGFNPELSGRDNVFLNGALLGFSRKEMEKMYDEIVDFAELAPHMGQKLKNYSSGMQVRLAFSIAVKAHNDILIFDEVLAVGDEAFQRKCLDIFEQYKANKQTVILVTHEMGTIKKFCNRALLISDGKVVEQGNPYKVANHYSKINQEIIDKSSGTKVASEEFKTQFLKASITDTKGENRRSFKCGEQLAVHISWPGLPSAKLESLGVNIFKESGEHVTGINTRFDQNLKSWQSSEHISINISLDIAPGKYKLLIEAFEKEGTVLDAIIDGPSFFVLPTAKKNWSGLVELPHSWKIG